MRWESKADDALSAEISLSLLVAPDEPLFPELAASLVVIASELRQMAPLGAVLDLLGVLVMPVVRLDEARAKLHSAHARDRELVVAISQWMDGVVAPLATSPATAELRDALASHPPSDRTAAAALVATEMLRRRSARSAEAGSFDLGMIRRTCQLPARDVRVQAARFLVGAGGCELLRARYHTLSASRGALVEPGDLLMAENAPVLRSRAARTGLRQMSETSESLSRRVPRTLPRKRSRGEASTSRTREEGSFPVGGFSSISNAGSLESVVSSELVYLNPGAELSEDLFTMRWALGELLYYTRDENVATRPRTTFSVVLDGSLALARRKDRGAPCQRLTLALASIHVFVQHTLHILRGEAVVFRLVFDPQLAEQRALMALTLVRELRAKTVELTEGTLADAEAFETETADRRRVVPIRFYGPREDEASSATVVIAANPPRIGGIPATSSDTTEAWANITRQLLFTV